MIGIDIISAARGEARLAELGIFLGRVPLIGVLAVVLDLFLPFYSQMKDETGIKFAIELEQRKSDGAEDNRKGVSLDKLVIIGNFLPLILGLDEVLVKILVIINH